MAAVARHSESAIRGLLKSGQDIGLNNQDEQGNTCLHYAALVDDHILFRLLQENGASLSIENKFEKTPLDIASSSNSLEMKNFVQRGGIIILWSSKKVFLEFDVFFLAILNLFFLFLNIRPQALDWPNQEQQSCLVVKKKQNK